MFLTWQLQSISRIVHYDFGFLFRNLSLPIKGVLSTWEWIWTIGLLHLVRLNLSRGRWSLLVITKHRNLEVQRKQWSLNCKKNGYMLLQVHRERDWDSPVYWMGLKSLRTLFLYFQPELLFLDYCKNLRHIFCLFCYFIFFTLVQIKFEN